MKEDYIDKVNAIIIYDVTFNGKRYEVQWNERDDISEATFAEDENYSGCEKMETEEYVELMTFIREEREKKK